MMPYVPREYFQRYEHLYYIGDKDVSEYGTDLFREYMCVVFKFPNQEQSAPSHIARLSIFQSDVDGDGRCDLESFLAILKHGARALHTVQSLMNMRCTPLVRPGFFQDIQSILNAAVDNDNDKKNGNTLLLELIIDGYRRRVESCFVGANVYQMVVYAAWNHKRIDVLHWLDTKCNLDREIVTEYLVLHVLSSEVGVWDPVCFEWLCDRFSLSARNFTRFDFYIMRDPFVLHELIRCFDFFATHVNEYGNCVFVIGIECVHAILSTMIRLGQDELFKSAVTETNRLEPYLIEHMEGCAKNGRFELLRWICDKWNERRTTIVTHERLLLICSWTLTHWKDSAATLQMFRWLLDRFEITTREQLFPCFDGPPNGPLFLGSLFYKTTHIPLKLLYLFYTEFEARLKLVVNNVRSSFENPSPLFRKLYCCDTARSIGGCENAECAQLLEWYQKMMSAPLTPWWLCIDA